MNIHEALIVDDERMARRELAYLLRDFPSIHVAGEAGSVDAAIAEIRRIRPALVFLDVQMAGETGFDLLARQPVMAKVIFVTAFDRFALRAFEVNALDYLMKPVNPARLREAVHRFLESDAGAASTPAVRPPIRLSYEDSILVTIDRAPRFVALQSIVCILADGDYTRLIGTSGTLGLVLKSMKDWEALLPERNFARIQRSAIVNCAHVRRFEPWFNGAYHVHVPQLAEPLVMSRRYARVFHNKYAV
jgi:two-component system LytT family response regulator